MYAKVTLSLESIAQILPVVDENQNEYPLEATTLTLMKESISLSDGVDGDTLALIEEEGLPEALAEGETEELGDVEALADGLVEELGEVD